MYGPQMPSDDKKQSACDDHGLSDGHSAGLYPAYLAHDKDNIVLPPLAVPTVVFLSLAPLCRYPNTHPNPLQNPLGVCVPVYKLRMTSQKGPKGLFLAFLAGWIQPDNGGRYRTGVPATPTM